MKVIRACPPFNLGKTDKNDLTGHAILSDTTNSDDMSTFLELTETKILWLFPDLEKMSFYRYMVIFLTMATL